MSLSLSRLKTGEALQVAALREATPLRTVQQCAGIVGAAALSPLGGLARSAKGVQ